MSSVVRAQHMNSHGGTFTHEVLVKYGEDRGEEVLTKIFRFYDRLPVAAFVGAAGPLSSPDQDRAYLLACHGGWEPGWSPRDWFAVRVHHNRGGTRRRVLIAALRRTTTRPLSSPCCRL